MLPYNTISTLTRDGHCLCSSDRKNCRVERASAPFNFLRLLLSLRGAPVPKQSRLSEKESESFKKGAKAPFLINFPLPLKGRGLRGWVVRNKSK